jgi:hypothetical protein
MKRFKDFINEGKTESKDSFEKFLKDVVAAIKHDFSHPIGYGEAYIKDYEEELKSAWEQGLTVREAIASTKRPGVIITDDKVEESYVFEIDNDFEEAYKKLESINGVNNLYEGEQSIKNYFEKYNKKKFSDKRIFERIKNNYTSLIKKYEEKRSKLNG